MQQHKLVVVGTVAATCSSRLPPPNASLQAAVVDTGHDALGTDGMMPEMWA